jgi:hypothetical protein
VATIFSAVLAAGSLLDLLGPARKARWIFLAALAGAAAVYAVRQRAALRPAAAYAAAAALLALAFASAAWSGFPGLTLARAASLALLFVACAALGLGAAGRLPSLRGLVGAIVFAAAAVAVGGLLVLAFAHDRAVQGATAQEPARYQGLGGGPNTAVMLLAVALPLAAHVALDGRTGRARLLGLAAAALLLGSIVASGSRGALLAAFAGLAAWALLAARGLRARALALGGVAALLVVSALATRLPDPDPTVPARPGTAFPERDYRAREGYLDASLLWRTQEDVGRPAYGSVPGETSRSLLGGSGRRQAWEGAIRLGAERPVAGYAFGTENKVFVDRYLHHGSNLPENSYVGLFLQLGLAGLASFLALVAALAWSARRALRAATGAARLAAACAGGLAAGLALALTQSYIYAAGSNAAAATWLCAFLLPAAAATADAEP